MPIVKVQVSIMGDAKTLIYSQDRETIYFECDREIGVSLMDQEKEGTYGGAKRFWKTTRTSKADPRSALSLEVTPFSPSGEKKEGGKFWLNFMCPTRERNW